MILYNQVRGLWSQVTACSIQLVYIIYPDIVGYMSPTYYGVGQATTELCDDFPYLYVLFRVSALEAG